MDQLQAGSGGLPQISNPRFYIKPCGRRVEEEAEAETGPAKDQLGVELVAVPTRSQNPIPCTLCRGRRCMEEAEAVTGFMSDELRAELAAVPNSASLAELEEAIITLQADADAIVCGNARVVQEHKCASSWNCLGSRVHEHILGYKDADAIVCVNA